MNNDLISREALKKEFAKHTDSYGNLQVGWDYLIDNAPTVPLPDFKEGYKQAIIDGKTNFSRPQAEWVEFADFVARNVVSEDFSEDVDFYAEVLCRKLVKLGLVKLDGDTYEYCGAKMDGKDEENA